MMPEPYSICPYSIEKIIELLKNQWISEAYIQNKNHIGYFQSYFDHVQAKTIIVENDYIDRDYLEDFASYYVRCFTEYKRHCKRLHFFKNKFDAAFFQETLSSGNQKNSSELQSNYIGFIVVKPLPQTIIGKTCLMTYGTQKETNRCYPINRTYTAHLFGIDLKVETLAFQEQDSEVAACATSTLWSVFHGTGIVFHHPIPSPSEITIAATKHQPIENRTFPNRGLSIGQIAHGIQSVGLEPLLIKLKTKSNVIFTGYLYAYLKFGIPMIFGFDLLDSTDDQIEKIGTHAVAITGFRLNDEPAHFHEYMPIKLTSSRVNKIYVHDDQVGPFARMEFNTFGNRNYANEDQRLTTSWKSKYLKNGKVYALPYIVMIPLYHKIRIGFETILSTVIDFCEIWKTSKEMYKTYEEYEWDIHLTDIKKLSESFFSQRNVR